MKRPLSLPVTLLQDLQRLPQSSRLAQQQSRKKMVVSYCLIMLLWSGVNGQLLSHHVAVVRGWSAIVSSYCCSQGLGVSYCHIMLLWRVQLLSHHVAVVRGWWSAIVTSCCCGQGLVVSYCYIMLLWSGVGGQLLTRSLEGPFRGAFGKKLIELSSALKLFD